MTDPHEPGRPGLTGHPDRLRWDARYGSGTGPGFRPHPLAGQILGPGPYGAGMDLPAGPVLELACGTSGGALLAAAAGRPVTAVDVSEVALGLLAAEAGRRGVGELITVVHADLRTWQAPAARYALVLCTRYWDAAVIAMAAAAVMPGGLLGWEAFTGAALAARPGMCPDWCLRPGEPAVLLPAGFTVLEQADQPDAARGSTRRLLARRLAIP